MIKPMIKSRTRTMSGILLAAVTTVATMQMPSQANAEEIFFIRGAMNIFSAGMNHMTDRMKSRGHNAKSLSNGQWSGVARDIIKRSKSGRVSYPIVIVGHSVGGQEAPQFSDMLYKAGVPVALVIGVDPGWAAPPPFTTGSPRVVNFWVGGTSRGNPYKSTAGFSGTIQNVDIRAFSKADHVQIDKDPQVQSRILNLISSVL